MASEYEKTGVDVHKKGIDVFKIYVKNIIPGAFCTAIPDPDLPGYGLVIHEDGAGSKTITNHLLAKEYGDNRYFESVAQDVLAMNIDDTDCVISKPIGFADYVAINRFTVQKQEFLKSLNNGFGRSFNFLEKFGIPINFAGGETADLPDQIRTVDVSGTIVSRVKLEDAITGKNIKPGNYIVGLRSGGKAKYEKKENSGIMCNGLTLARHCLTHKSYEIRYPEIRDPQGKPYTGRFKLDEHLDEVGMTLGEALISPTRIFSPITKKILEKHKEDVVGIVHNTGGGQTKILRLGFNIHYIKSMPQEPDPIFNLIQNESGESWRDMYQGFNMGTGMEFIVKDVETADGIKDISESFGVGAKLIGHTKKGNGSNRLTIYSKFGTFQYP